MNSANAIENAVKRIEDGIEAQRKKVHRIGRELRPNLTEEDLLQPHDIPELEKSSLFNFEDGVLAGLLQALTVLHSLEG